MRDLPILVIADPDAQIRTIIAALLADAFQVVHADSLQAAYHLLPHDHAAMLILSLEQPDGDGLTFIAAVREIWSPKALVISCLSTRNDIRTKVTAFRQGADDYVVKPYHATDWYSVHLRLLWRLHGVPSRATSGA